MNDISCNKYNTMKTGFLAGAVAGVADIGITYAYNKHQANSSRNKFKNMTFAQKRALVKDLWDKNISGKEYKQAIEKISKKPSIKSFAKRALLYGSILGLVGLLLDIKGKNETCCKS